MVNHWEKKKTKHKNKITARWQRVTRFAVWRGGKKKKTLCVMYVPCLQRGEPGSWSLKPACEVTGDSFFFSAVIMDGSLVPNGTRQLPLICRSPSDGRSAAVQRPRCVRAEDAEERLMKDAARCNLELSWSKRSL